MLLGPLLDKMLVGSFPHTWTTTHGESSIAMLYLLLSCCLAVVVNYSQARRSILRGCVLMPFILVQVSLRNEPNR
jgi:hypothetical protein